MTLKNTICLTTICFFISTCTDERTSEQITADIREKIKTNDFTSAQKDTKILIEKEPNSSVAHFLKGLVETKQKNNQQAIISFQRAIELDTMYYQVYVERAKLKIELGDYKSAISDCQTAKFIKKEYPDIYKTEGIAYENLGEIYNAIIVYKYAIKYGDNNGDTFYKLGMLLLNIGKTAEACENLSKAGELGYMDAYDLIKSNCNNQNFEIKEKKKINNIDAYYFKISFSFFSQNLQKTLSGISMFYVLLNSKTQKLYYLQGNAETDNVEKYEPVYRKTFETFKLL